MKIRSGFVSNSSSSSFVVALPKDVKPELNIKIDLTKYIKGKISTIKELNEYWKKNRDEIDDLYERCRKSIDLGEVVYIGWFSDEDYGDIQCGLCHRGIKLEDMPDGGLIIQSEEGY